MPQIGPLENISLAPTQTQASRRGRRDRAPGLTRDKRESLLAQASNIGMGSLEMAAGVLDTPGSSVRALLAGDLGAAASGVTNWDDRISGRDLLEAWNLVGKNKEGFGGSGGWGDIDWGDAAGDIAGFLTEVVTDPLTYTGIGALTKAGQAAKVAGKGTRGFIPSIRSGERSLVSLGLPLTNLEAHFTGPAAAKTGEVLGGLASSPARAADLSLGVLGYDRPLARAGDWTKRATAAILDPRARGKMGAAEQSFARSLSDFRSASEMELRSVPRQSAITFMRGLEKFKAEAPELAEKLGPKDYEVFGDLVTTATEVGVDRAIAHHVGAPVSPEASAALQTVVDEFRSSRDAPFFRGRKAGASNEFLGGEEFEIGQSPRTSDIERLTGEKPRKKGSRGVGFGAANALSRNEAIRNVPKVIVNDMTQDPVIREAVEAAASSGRPLDTESISRHIMEKYGDWLQPNFGEVVDEAMSLRVGEKVLSTVGSKELHASALAEYIPTLPPGIFNRHINEDHARYIRGMSIRASNIEAAQKFISESIDEAGTVTLDRFYKETSGFNRDRSLKYVAEILGVTPEEAAKLKITDETADIIRGSLLPLQKDSGVGKEIAEFFDKWLNLIKFSQTVPWPKFHMTNMIGGHYLNLASGLMRTPKDVAEYGKAVFDVLLGRVDKRTLEEINSLEVLGGAVMSGLDDRVADDLVRAGIRDSRASQGVELGQRLSPEEMAARPLPSRLWSATGGRYTNFMGWIGGGIERTNRAPLYVYLKRKAEREGLDFDPIAAAREVGKRQIDYGLTTPAERAVLKRLFPYWSWIRGSSEIVLGSVLQSPGGVAAQTIRATDNMRETEGLPSYLQERTAIPLPGSDSRFLTDLGLPTDDVFSRFSVGADASGTAQNVLEHVIGMSNPLASSLYTLASERQPFFGRNVRDLRPVLGDVFENITGDEGDSELRRLADDPMVNALLNVTPFARAASTLRQGTDERKPLWNRAANLLSPVRVTDVAGGVEYQKAREDLDAVTELLRVHPAARSYESYYSSKFSTPSQESEVQDLIDLQGELRRRMFAVKED